MKKLYFFLITLLTATTCVAEQKSVFKGTFYNKENDITIAIDLYDTTIVSPNYSFLGKLNGYMTGRLYDAWFVTSFHLENNKATVKFSNDLGSDVQEVLFTFDDKGQLVYSAQGANVVRRAENRKWIKLPDKMIFVEKKPFQKSKKEP